jgi:hypothetical protein
MSKAKKKTVTELEQHPMEGMNYWREQVRGLLPEERDQWKIGILATTLKLQAGVLIESWREVRRFLDDNEGIAMGFSVKVDTSKTPPTVKLVMSHAVPPPRWNAESDVPDEAQSELPGIIHETEATPVEEAA